MMIQHQNRPLPTMSFGAGSNTQSIKVPTDLPALGIRGRMTGNLVVGGATSATIVEDSILNLLSAIVMRAGVSQPKASLYLETIFKNNWFYSAFDPGFAAPAVTAGTNAFSMGFYLDLSAPDFAKHHEDSSGGRKALWDPRELNEASLDITCGAAAAIATAASAGAPISLTSVAVELSIDQVIGVPRGKRPYHRETPFVISGSGAATDVPVKINTGGLILGFDLICESGASGGTNSNSIVTSLKMRKTTTSGPTEYPLDSNYLLIRGENRQRYAPTAISGTNAPADTGFLKVERRVDARPGRGVKDLDLLITTTGAYYVRGVVRELIDQ